MKQKRAVIVISLLALAALVGFFHWIKEQCRVPVPEASVLGGYYQDPFVLEFRVPTNGTIYYTTDGSLPTEQSAVYTDGIPIVNRSGEPNIYNAVQNVVSDWKTYTPDPTPVEKGTVVRAIFVNDWGLQSDVFTQTYFVGIAPPERGYTLSLIFAYDDLFGDNGIYVTGKEYDQWYLSGDTTVPEPQPNFLQETEVSALAELMDSSGDVMNQAVGLRLQGATTREAWNKRFTLVAREAYGGNTVFDTVLYDGVITHSVMLKDCLIDAIVADLVSDRSAATQDSIPVRVYLNGEFWYNSYLLERYDSTYFQQHYQVSNHALIKNGAMDDDTAATAKVDLFYDFLYQVEHTDVSDPEQWARFQDLIDVQSYIDYIVTNYYLCNFDFTDFHNHVFWRSASFGDGEYEDMRWRWCIYDIDALTWSPYEDSAALNVFSDPEVYGIENTTVFRALRTSPEFCQQFVLSFMDMVNNNFAPERVEQVLAKYGYTLDWMDGYFRKRPAYAAQHLAEEFTLTGTLETVHISTQSPEMGTVTVNTSQIDLSDGTWSGQYFTDYPITITATANDGYQFLGWKGGADQTASTITCPVDGGLTLEAVFAELQ